MLEKRSLNNADAVDNTFDKRPNAGDLQMIEFQDCGLLASLFYRKALKNS